MATASDGVNLIRKYALPENALLQKYVASGDYTDCYTTIASGNVNLAEFVAAFYTTWLFKLERIILRWAVSKPSTDEQVQQLAEGRRDRFAAWYVEAREDNQLLMCDFRGRTRSWFMLRPRSDGSTATTRLLFGSAVVAVLDKRSGKQSLGPVYAALLGFHRLYSRALLFAARRKLTS